MKRQVVLCFLEDERRNSKISRQKHNFNERSVDLKVKWNGKEKTPFIFMFNYLDFRFATMVYNFKNRCRFEVWKHNSKMMLPKVLDFYW